MKRQKATDHQDIVTPGGTVILGTFGPHGSNGWDLWVPDKIAVSSIRRGKKGTLVRLARLP
jgi:hypothetical protein